VCALTEELFGVRRVEDSLITCDHNHLAREEHAGQWLLVHRKGAMPASLGAPGVLPGSMGTLSYHVEGRGNAEALRSSAHGAGRALSRQAARQRFTAGDLRRQMGSVWFDPRLSAQLREEAPKAYKDIRKVLRAQEDLVKVTCTLRPALTYKGT
jgi:tRNA-splicing ligase RtcB